MWTEWKNGGGIVDDKSEISRDCYIESNCCVKNSKLSNCRVNGASVISEAEVADSTLISSYIESSDIKNCLLQHSALKTDALSNVARVFSLRNSNITDSELDASSCNRLWIRDSFICNSFVDRSVKKSLLVFDKRPVSSDLNNVFVFNRGILFINLASDFDSCQASDFFVRFFSEVIKLSALPEIIKSKLPALLWFFNGLQGDIDNNDMGYTYKEVADKSFNLIHAAKEISFKLRYYEERQKKR